LPRVALKFDIPIHGTFFDTDESRQTVGAFLMKYLELFDNDRSGLVDVYSGSSVFSVCVNANYPATVTVCKGERQSSGSHGQRGGYPNDSFVGIGEVSVTRDYDQSLVKRDNPQPRHQTRTTSANSTAGGWCALDRNLMRRTNLDSRVSSQFVGAINIVHALCSLPKTEHSTSAWVMDSWQVLTTQPAQLIINVHGQLLEGN
jgi:hypothetical protein